MALALGIAACSDSNHSEPQMEYVEMPVRLSIPASGMSDPTRAPGDPGTYERFEIPTVAYMYFCTTYGGVETVTSLATTLSADRWIKTTIAPGNPESDSIYTYTGSIQARLPKSRSEGRVYVALCNVPVFSGTKPFPTMPAGEEAVKNTRIEINTKDLRANLHNLYSSPYNLMVNKADGSGREYYGTIQEINTQQPHVDMILYHVAAKIDLTWNVAPNIQRDVRITYIEAQGLAASCLLFKPMETVYDSGSKYNLHLMADPASEYPWCNSDTGITPGPGNRWYGRLCFYTIPHFTGAGGTFNLKLRLMQNSDELTSSGLTESSGLTINNIIPMGYQNEYTPWIRLNLDIKSSLYEDKELVGGKQTEITHTTP